MVILKYCILGKFGGEKVGQIWRIICDLPTKTIQISTYNYNLGVGSIHLSNFFCQMLKTSKFAKLSPCQTFPLYGTLWYISHKKCFDISQP